MKGQGDSNFQLIKMCTEINLLIDSLCCPKQGQKSGEKK